MTDFQLSILAEDRRTSLMAEAERERLARTFRARGGRPRRARGRVRFVGLGQIFRRLAHD
jgi:hypothetical protein